LRAPLGALPAAATWPAKAQPTVYRLDCQGLPLKFSATAASDQAEAILQSKKKWRHIAGRDGADAERSGKSLMAARVLCPQGSGLTSALLCAPLSLGQRLRHRSTLTDPPRAVKPRPPSARALRKTNVISACFNLRTRVSLIRRPQKVFATFSTRAPTFARSDDVSHLAAQGRFTERRRQRRHPSIRNRIAARRTQSGLSLDIQADGTGEVVLTWLSLCQSFDIL